MKNKWIFRGMLAAVVFGLVFGIMLVSCDIGNSVSVASLTGTWKNSEKSNYSLTFTTEKTVTVKGYGVSLSSWSYSLDGETMTVTNDGDSYTGTVKLHYDHVTLDVSGFTDFWAKNLNGTWIKE
jgi:hypothetical protein